MVVVVVTVLVSTHSARSKCSRADRPAAGFSSSHLTDTCWLGRLASGAFWRAEDEVMVNFGEESGVAYLEVGVERGIGEGDRERRDGKARVD